MEIVCKIIFTFITVASGWLCFVMCYYVYHYVCIVSLCVLACISKCQARTLSAASAVDALHSTGRDAPKI